MTFQQLQKQVLDLPPGDRWVLLKLLVESLQPTPPPFPQATPTVESTSGNEDNSLAQYYGCIDDETFFPEVCSCHHSRRVGDSDAGKETQFLP